MCFARISEANVDRGCSGGGSGRTGGSRRPRRLAVVVVVIVVVVVVVVMVELHDHYDDRLRATSRKTRQRQSYITENIVHN